MYANNKHLLRATLIVSALMPAALAAAADLPLPPPTPAWTWSGLYFGGSAGAAAGTATFSDPEGPSVFGDKVNTAAFLAGLQLGYNWQVAPRWVVGLQADASYLDSNGSFTCMQASAAIVGSNCEVSPRVLASLTGRVGLLVDPVGHTLLYAKGGAAWMGSDISITPNNSNIAGAPEPDGDPSSRSKAWGWTVGAGIERALTPAWSIGLEYDYYRFASSNVATAATISSTGGATPIFSTLAGTTASVTPDIQVVKLALNYHWDHDPRMTWVDGPIFGAAALPFRARPAAPSFFQGWEVDAGTRYWYSGGTEKNTSGTGTLISQLTSSNLTGQSGELFARVDTQSRIFVKGYVGTGAITGGKNTDEDWGAGTQNKTGFQVADGTTSGWLNYAAADIGYNVLRDSNYKFGPFVGYSYFRQNINTYGCNFSVPAGQACATNGQAATPNTPVLTEDETWQSFRVGVSAVATIWDRFGISGDVAYLPYSQYSGLDSHLFRVPITFFPQNGSGRGAQTELILTYLVTENLKLGIGGRYWAMWTEGARQSCHGDCGDGFTSSPSLPYTANTERFGGFVQASYQFATQP
jgi:opacity protein-like surface antigen/outer membrane protease